MPARRNGRHRVRRRRGPERMLAAVTAIEIFPALTTAAKRRHAEARSPAAIDRTVGLVIVDPEPDAHATFFVSPSDGDDAARQDDREETRSGGDRGPAQARD